MSLPDQRPTELVGQPQPRLYELEPYERPGMIWVAGPGNQFVAVPRDILPADYFQSAPPARDLTPRPGIDPVAQRMLYGGVGTGAAAAGVGWGLGEAAAGLSSGGGLLLLCLLAAWKLSTSRGGGNTTRITQTVHHHNRWFGKSTTNL